MPSAEKLQPFGSRMTSRRAAFPQRNNCLIAVSFFAPGRPVFQGPIKQGAFKTAVVASFLALDPFVTTDLLAFGVVTNGRSLDHFLRR
jgi:hypothetical protein